MNSAKIFADIVGLLIVGTVVVDGINVYREDNRTDVGKVLISGSEASRRWNEWKGHEMKGRSIFAVPENAIGAALDEITGLHPEGRKDLEKAIADQRVSFGYVEVWDPDRPEGGGATFQMGSSGVGGSLSQTVKLTNKPQRVYLVRPVRTQTVEECKALEACQDVCGPDTTFKSPACRLTITVWTDNTSVGVRFVEGLAITSPPSTSDPRRTSHSDPFAVREMPIL